MGALGEPSLDFAPGVRLVWRETESDRKVVSPSRTNVPRGSCGPPGSSRHDQLLGGVAHHQPEPYRPLAPDRIMISLYRGRTARMTPGVQQDVANRVPNLPGRLQNPHVVIAAAHTRSGQVRVAAPARASPRMPARIEHCEATGPRCVPATSRDRDSARRAAVDSCDGRRDSDRSYAPRPPCVREELERATAPGRCPWMGSNKEDQKWSFVLEFLSKQWSMTELCERFRVSWNRRQVRSDGFEEEHRGTRSGRRRPHRGAHRIPEDVGMERGRLGSLAF